MSSSLLRLTFAATIALTALPTIVAGQTTEKPPKQKKVVNDPFAEIQGDSIPSGDPIPLTQESGTPFETINKPVRPQKIEDPFRLLGDPVERTASRQTEDPFAQPKNAATDQAEAINGRPVRPEDQLPLTQTFSDQEQPKVAGTSEQALPEKKSFEDKFWEYLQSNAYENWAPAPGQNGDFYQGRSPHGEFLKMYLNRTAAAASDDLPNGSIIVKENYAADQKTLTAITVMYRSKNYNPDAGDWYWVKYNPDGTTAESAGRKIMGKAQSCIECHGGAANNDFTFFNDK